MVAVDLVLATHRDKQRLAALSKSIWLPYFKEFFPPDELAALYHGMYGPKALDTLFSATGYELFFLVVPEGVDVGYLGVAWDGKVFKLDKIYLDANYRGTGLGSWVMGRVIAMARAHGAGEVQLRVNIENRDAIAFYGRHGFTIRSREAFPGPRGFVYDDYRMSLKLEAGASPGT